MLRFFFRKSIEAAVRKMTKNSVTQSRSTQKLVVDSVTPLNIALAPLARLSWRTPIAAASLALLLSLAAQDVNALALGRVNVLSALGEPLRAEIDVPEITAEEAATLRTAVAGPEAFRAAGLEYNPALSGVQISLQRRANGSAFLRLSSDRPVNEPFVDLILEANWASGRIVRDYTMLFDPSNMRSAAAPAITAPAAASGPATVAPRSSIAIPREAAAPEIRPARVERATAKAPAKPAREAPEQGIKVKQGDTAAALAARYKPAGVSLDQMLVAMLNTSPDAFSAGNINRLKSGAVIDMQSAAAGAPGTGESDAKQTIVAQSKDFNEFRRRLAAGAPVAAAPAAGRTAGGKVQANVSEPKAQATAPDKLTLSKGSVAAKAKEEAIAKDKQAKESAARVAELSKNIQDLNKLGTTTVAKPGAAAPTAGAASAPGVSVAAAPSAVPASAVAKPAASVSAPTPAAAPTPVASSPASATPTAAAASAPAATTSTVAAPSTPTVATPTVAAAPVAPPASAPKPKASPPPPPPEPTFIESLMDNPLLIPGAGLLLAGLGGLAFWRTRKKNAAQVDSSFLESRLQPDSFFGASGGQRVDTADSGNAAGPGSSMVYSPSQLDAAGDVDPVAEADVYLAYGRDLQAEEILKEAMRTNPSRLAIHSKLMEIYAKRRDGKAFEGVAKEAFNLTQGTGPEWDAASVLGRELDPTNPLYQAGNAPASAGLAGSVTTGAAIAASAAMATAAFSATRTVPQQAQSAGADDFDIDLDLDFSAGPDDLVAAPDNAGMISTLPLSEPTVSLKASVLPEPMVDFDMSLPAELGDLKLSEPDLSVLTNSLNFSAPPVPSAMTEPMALKTGPSEPSSLEFDLGGLSLDLPGSSSSASASDAIDAGVSGDPLETKLALAMEFRDIGDADGARSLVSEVVDEATGALKARATKMLADLG
jgi:pilus assembly protein FimV